MIIMIKIIALYIELQQFYFINDFFPLDYLHDSRFVKISDYSGKLLVKLQRILMYKNIPVLQTILIIIVLIFCSSNKTVKKSADSDIHCDFSVADLIHSYEWC